MASLVMDYDELIASRSIDNAAPTAPGTRQVIGWVSTAGVEPRRLVDVGGWGGGIQAGDRWNNYIIDIDKRYVAHHEALRRAIIVLGLRRGGDWHQNAPNGVPVFDDGAVGTFSFRAWGDLLAAVWAEFDGRDYSYMNFYMDSCLVDAGIELSPPLSSKVG